MLRYFASGVRRFGLAPIDVHSRPNWEFYAVLSGRIAPVLETGPLPLCDGPTLWIFPPHTPHGWTGRKRPAEIVAMHFGTVPTIVDHLTRAHGFAAVALSADQTARVRSLADDVASHYHHPTLASPVHCDRALCELALMACDETPCHALPSIENLQRDKVARALSWCETHLELRPKVAHIAREVHVSPSHLRRLFWRHRGESPKAAFRHIQIESAVRELTTTSSCLDEIAARCGFANAAELSRLFKERFGMTAGRWRRKVIGPYKEPPRAESLSE